MTCTRQLQVVNPIKRFCFRFRNILFYLKYNEIDVAAKLLNNSIVLFKYLSYARTCKKNINL